MTTLVAQTDNALAAVHEAEGKPTNWTMTEARAVWAACPSKGLFDGFEDFMCSLIVYARRAR